MVFEGVTWCDVTWPLASCTSSEQKLLFLWAIHKDGNPHLCREYFFLIHFFHVIMVILSRENVGKVQWYQNLDTAQPCCQSTVDNLLWLEMSFSSKSEDHNLHVCWCWAYSSHRELTIFVNFKDFKITRSALYMLNHFHLPWQFDLKWHERVRVWSR